MDKGAQLGHYEIVAALGKGGMGEVYLAQDTRLDRRVALKILPAEWAADSDRLHRFIREAKSASALNHPNIITVYDIGEAAGTPFIAYEFIDGVTLREFASSAAANLASSLEIGIQIASALVEAHHAGIVHRDLKPDNVMVRQSGLVKLLDFGIARLSRPAEAADRRCHRHSGADAARPVDRHAAVHVARAGAWHGRRPPDGHLQLRRGDVRSAVGCVAVSRATRSPTSLSRS